MMKFDPEKHHRRSIRLPGFDYSRVGVYFVTVCAHDRQPVFGDVIDGEMILNELGQIAVEEWIRTAVIRARVRLDAFIVMPNHIHGILVIADEPDGGGRGTLPRADTPQTERFGRPTSDSVPTIMRLFKTAVTGRIRHIRDLDSIPVWQRGYYEHVIRDDDECAYIRGYIEANPARWVEDQGNPGVP